MKDETVFSAGTLHRAYRNTFRVFRVTHVVLQFQEQLHSFNNHLRCHLTDLVAHGSPLQQQSEAVGCLLVVLQALTQPAIIILHQSPVHNHFQLA